MIRLPQISLSAKVTAGVVTAVLIISAGSTWFLQAFYRRQMIESVAESTTAHGKLVEQSLRYAMHTRSLDLLVEMVRSLGDQKEVEKVMILDKKGVVRFSSDQEERGRTMNKSDPTCRICHEVEAANRGRTEIFEREDGPRVFRNVNPILNSQTCYGCHPSTDRINGVLIVDYSMAAIQASLDAGARKMWLAAVILAVVITGVIVVLMRHLILNRLRTLVQVVDSIEAGHIERFERVGGADEIGILSQHLNDMAITLDQSLHDLREREAFLDAVISSADDGIVVIDEDLRIVTANRAFEEIIGAPAGDTSAVPCECSLSCSLADPRDCPAKLTFKTGQVAHRVRSLAAPDGTNRYFEISASPLQSTDASQQVLEVWRDITGRREIEAQLANSERLASLGLLAAGLSHEINNPLASITTCLDGLRRRIRQQGDGHLPEEFEEYLELIRGEVNRCSELTERLKVFGRRPHEVPQRVDITEVVGEIVALVRYLAEKERVEIELRLAPTTEPVIGDEQKIRQIILNLVLNAIQAIDGPGRLEISTAGDDGEVTIEVADSGTGIEPHELQQIFEPFYSSRPDGRGTGLGLFISKIIVDQLGGSIDVTSTLGEGTRFIVRFPTTPRAALEAIG
jgi:signal transduction histidine kinase